MRFSTKQDGAVRFSTRYVCDSCNRRVIVSTTIEGNLVLPRWWTTKGPRTYCDHPTCVERASADKVTP